MRTELKKLFALCIIFSETVIFSGGFLAFDHSRNNLFASNLEKSSVLSTETDQPSYLLGPGDMIQINFLGLEELSGSHFIGMDGNINLIDIGRVKASDFTVVELENYLEKKSQKFVKNPSISVAIIKYRPIKVFVGGEVRIPGLYDFSLEEKTPLKVIRIPTLYDALRSAGGITQYSDFKNIKVIRLASKHSGDNAYIANINLFELFIGGDQSQNISLLDSDTIIVGKSPTIIKDQFSKIANSNLQPSTVRVYVSGNVRKPGEILISNNSSLTQAIALAGGIKKLSGNISFLRFDRNGKLEKRTFSNKLSQNTDINSYRNPRLISGDIIHVEQSLFGKSAELIKTVSPPIINTYAIYKIFGEN